MPRLLALVLPPAIALAALTVTPAADPPVRATAGGGLKPLKINLHNEPVIERKSNLTYATVDGEQLQLDLVVPKAGGPHPAVLCLHGGAWRFGTRYDPSFPMDWTEVENADADFLDLLAKRGFAAASASYRFAPKHRFPAQVADAKAAVRYLRANAAALNLDPDRIAVLGFSAGGHLATLVGATPGRPEFEPAVYADVSDRVKCVVNFYGPTDLSLYHETPGIEWVFCRPFLGALSAEKPDVYKKASPIEYAAKDLPPILTLHGTADVVVPVIHAERFHAKLLAAGATSVFLPVRGKGHGWGGEAAVEALAAVAKFLSEHLAPGAK